jgi:hypothetical protein
LGRFVVLPSLAQALLRLVRERFDVIILNFFLPDGTGPLILRCSRSKRTMCR